MGLQNTKDVKNLYWFLTEGKHKRLHPILKSKCLTLSAHTVQEGDYFDFWDEKGFMPPEMGLPIKKALQIYWINREVYYRTNYFNFLKIYSNVSYHFMLLILGQGKKGTLIYVHITFIIFIVIVPRGLNYYGYS